LQKGIAMAGEDLPIDVWVRDVDVAEGAKAWGVSSIVDKLVSLDTKEMVNSLKEFSAAISASLSGTADRISDFALNSLEFTVELTAKGEVRLIAAASTELKGGIKLVFSRIK
jgi:hypothetical protein